MLQIPICGLLLVLAAPAADEALSARLQALSAVGSAEVPRPSRDTSRLVFVTSLFGSRQVAVMPIDGGYPVQLTAEREGVVSVRYSPTDPRQLVAVVRRDGRRRIVVLDDQGSPAEEVDPAPGDQLPGGFSRDGRRFFFATVSEGKGRLFQFQLGGHPDAGAATGSAAARPASATLAEVLADIQALGPPSPDGRSLLVVTSKGGGNDVWSIELSSTRATLLTPHEGKARFSDPRWNP